MQDRDRVEWLKCDKSPAYFIHQYTWIENATAQAWVRFLLWPAQRWLLGQMISRRQLIILKARQLGITWLCLAYALWLMVFRPAATVLLFSLRDKEAMELLSRLSGMYQRLPQWAQCEGIEIDNAHEWKLSNGSRAIASTTTAGGRSLTGTIALVDEADFINNLAAFLNAAKPTIDAGGKIFLLSTVDKSRPLSTFKIMFRAARRKASAYKAIFLPWHARPERDQAWYERIAADMRLQGNGDDDLYQEYPATVDQALAPLQKNKRFKLAWLERAATVQPVMDEHSWLPGLRVYVAPQQGRRYVIGADSAEGNPHSDDSCATVLDEGRGAQVAVLVGKLEPATFASYLDQLAAYYNNAAIMAERNNHGHATILALRESGRSQMLAGYDGKDGWLSNAKGKRLLYDWTAEELQTGGVTIPDEETRVQLASIEANTLRAPAGQHDDLADGYCLAHAGRRNWGGSTLA